MGRSLPPLLRAAIFLRDGGQCVYCCKTFEEGARLTIDHVKAATWGGSDEPSNLVTACEDCNLEKGVIVLRAYVLHCRLKRRPYARGIAARVAMACARPVDFQAAVGLMAGLKALRRSP